jgi:hypothetical protein
MITTMITDTPDKIVKTLIADYDGYGENCYLPEWNKYKEYYGISKLDLETKMKEAMKKYHNAVDKIYKNHPSFSSWNTSYDIGYFQMLYLKEKLQQENDQKCVECVDDKTEEKCVECVDDKTEEKCVECVDDKTEEKFNEKKNCGNCTSIIKIKDIFLALLPGVLPALAILYVKLK